MPASHFAAHAGHHKEHHENKCEKSDGECIDVSDESALTCSSKLGRTVPWEQVFSAVSGKS